MSSNLLSRHDLDRRLASRLHGRLSYDKYASFKHDGDAVEKQMAIELEQAKRFYELLDQSEVFYDVRDELHSRGVTNTSEPPEVLGDYEYYNTFRVAKEENYHVLLRKSLKDQSEQVVFDPLRDQPFPRKYINSHSIMGFSLSDDQSFVGISVDVRSNELPTGYIKDLRNNKLLADR